MKQLLAVLIILTISLSSPSCGLALFTNGPDMGPAEPTGIVEKGTKVLSSNQFILNQGQLADDDIIFHSANAQFTSKGVRFRTTAPSSEGPQASNLGQLPQQAKRSFPIAYDTDVFEVEFVGANDVIPVGKEQLPYPTNFFIGNDASRWVSNVPCYKVLVYKDLYDGIDLVYTTVPEGIKYEFIVQPGADHTNIRLAYHGAELSTDGQALLISTPHTTVIDGGLMAYETPEQYGPISSRTMADVSIVLLDNTVSYKVLGHDNAKVLVIDPLIFSTFLGASSNEEPSNVVLDPSGNIVVAGTTSSLDFPTTTGAYAEMHAGGPMSAPWDQFVSKLSADGSTLLFSTFLGGPDDYESVGSLVLDASSNIYLTGTTNSFDFPVTAGAFCTTFQGERDAYLVKLKSDGSDLVFSTFLGGSSYDEGLGLSVNTTLGYIYASGTTNSTDFPTTPESYKPSTTYEWDFYVAKLKLDGSAILNSTYLGGSGEEICCAMKAGPDGKLYLAGFTSSQDLPTTPGAFDSTYNGGNYDIMVLQLNADLTDVLVSTYIGGGGDDRGYDIELDPSGNILLTGVTTSSNFPTTQGALADKLKGVSDAYVTKLASDGTSLVFSSYVGGSSNEIAYGLETDPDGNFILAGQTSSKDLATLGAFCATYNGGFSDAFLLRLSSDASEIIYCTYLGGSSDETVSWNPLVLAKDGSGDAVLVGATLSSKFPVTPGAYDTSYTQDPGGGGDGFILRFSFPITPPGPPVDLSGISGDGFVELSWTAPTILGDSPITNYIVSRGNSSANLSQLLVLGNSSMVFNDTNVTNGLKYYYALKAVNGAGRGPFSNEVIMTPSRVPDPPLNVKVVPGDSYAILNWSPPDYDGGAPVVGYKVLRGTAPDDLYYRTVLGNITGLNDSILENGRTYYYRVCAINVRGDSPFSSMVNTSPGRAPNKPVNFTFVDGNRFVELQWDAPGNDGGFEVLHYRLYRAKMAENLSFEKELDNQTFTYRDSTVENGITYRYAISAVNQKGEGPMAGPISSLPGRIPDNVALLAEPGDGIVKLVWGKPMETGGFGNLSYWVFKSLGSGPFSQIYNTTDLFYNDTNVTNGNLYSYSVAVLNAKGLGPRSAIAAAKPYGKPGQPTELKLISNEGQINISWRPPINDGGNAIVSYNIYRGPNATSLTKLADATGLTYKDSQLTNGVRWYYAISALNGAGEGPLTTATDAMATSVPGPVRDLKAKEMDGRVLLSWTAPFSDGGIPISSYRVYRGPSASDLGPLSNVTDGSTALNVTAANGVTYYYKVSAINTKGEGPHSDVISAAAGTVPGEPRDLVVKSQGRNVKLTWKPPLDDGGHKLVKYIIFRGTNKHESGSIAKVIAGNATVYIDKDVEPGKRYYYTVTAVNDLGEGRCSDMKGVTDGSNMSMMSLLVPILVAVIAIVAVVVGVVAYKRMSSKGKKEEKGKPKKKTKDP